MGNQRLLIETALRDAVLLLHRDQVPSASIARVSARFADLQRDFIESENLKGASGASHYLAKDAAADVMSSVLDRLFNVDIPIVIVRRLEEQLHAAHAQLEIAQQERAAALAKVDEMKIKERRHTDAHTYALHCYFREVFQLRQTIGLATTPTADGTSGAMMSPRGGALERMTSLLQGLSTSSPPRHAQAPPTRNKESLAHSTLSVTLPVTPLSSSLSNPALGSIGSQSVTQAYHTDAIFDYEKYLNLQRSDDMAWEAKYQQLNEDFTAYMNQVEKDRAFNEKQHQILVKVYQDRYNSLQRRLDDELRRQESMKLLVRAAVRQMADERKQIKQEVHQMQKSMAEYSREVSVRIGCVGDYNQVLVDFVKAACKYISERQTAQEGSKVEEITRFRFQRSLVPAPTDTQNLREAKMFWRRHDVSHVLFATVMDHRQNLDERAELLSNVAELRQTVKQLHQENHDLVTSQASYGFVGLQSLLQAAAAHVMPMLNPTDAHATLAVTTADDALATPAPTGNESAMGLRLVSDKAATVSRGGLAYIAVPPAAMWMLSQPMPSAVLPSATTDAIPNENVLYLRTKLSPDEVDNFTQDRLFAHRMFACGRDPSYYLRDDDRQTILTAWRAHKALVHQRNRLIFRHSDLRRVHRNLVAFHNALAAASSRLASLTDGTLPLTRPDVLATRERVQHLAEYEEEAELNYQRKRQWLGLRIEKNISSMYQALERHVAMTLRGVFPATIRAHHTMAPLPFEPALTLQHQQQQQQLGHGALSRAATTKSLTRRVSSKSSVGMSWQTSVEMPLGTVTVSTQTTFPAAAPGEARRPVPPWASVARKEGDPGTHHQDQSGASRGTLVHNRFLVQSTNHFATTEEQDDDASSFFRVESLAPPRCITIPTLGGLGPPELSEMSIKLLTRTSLMTTSTQLRKVLEESAEALATGSSPSRSPRAAPRPGSGAVVTSATRTGGFRVGSAASSRATSEVHYLQQRPPSGSSTRDRDVLLPPHYNHSRGASATAARQASATSPRSLPPAPPPSRLLSAATARVTTLPPAVYSTTSTTSSDGARPGELGAL